MPLLEVACPQRPHRPGDTNMAMAWRHVKFKLSPVAHVIKASLFLVAMPGAPSSVLVPSSDARSP